MKHIETHFFIKEPSFIKKSNTCQG